MLKELDLLESDALSNLNAVENLESLEQWRIENLGRSSSLMQVFDHLGQMAKEDRPAVGRRANEVKKALEAAHSDKNENLVQIELLRSLETERLDITLPGRPIINGRFHPITQTMRKIYHIFGKLMNTISNY